jgi:ribosomal protein S18 acetylase RimI-like enzyme
MHKETSKVKIVKLAISDWKDFKEMRLAALKEEPQAFGSSYAKEAAYPDSMWQERLREGENKKGIYLFAKLEGKMIGMVMGGRTDEDQQAGLAHVWGTYVDLKARGKGVGKELMQRVIEEIGKDMDVQKILVGVNAEQKPAIKLYESFGFKQIKTMLMKMGDGSEHQELEMEKKVWVNRS